MNKFIKRIKNNQALYILSILIIGILLLLIARITYAYLAPRIQSALSNITTISDTVDDFKLELEHTLTDMKTGNQEEALIEMGKRLNISSMTQIVVGLLGVLRGDNQTSYFEMLYEKFYKEELARIKKKNSVKVNAISKVTMLLILPVVGMILIGVILVLMEELKNNGVM